MKKKKRNSVQPKKKENENLTISDSIGDDILEKLKAAKKELTAKEREKEEKRQEQLRLERKEQEKNKSFAELLAEHDKQNS
ncbi:YqkE family protein [Sporosarcina sp. G11-34]|uniref:YqkE family protein n=1 Tax=Sporosarcina sp. G11-34 TaxID=2849605 RepID=UPI002E75C4A3|nr:YqkE family protein [Sporosarcina sp. G11-34]